VKVRILRVASAELEEAVAYYNTQLPGLGYEIAAEFKDAVASIVEYPEAWAPFGRHGRRRRLSRFPYGVVYCVADDRIVITGFMHLARDPQRWEQRVENGS
jgi:plasmid stabilization system protein ParE